MLTSLPDMLDDLLDAPVAAQKPVHGGDGSTSSDLPFVAPALPPSPVIRFQSPASTYHSLQLLTLHLHHLAPSATGDPGSSGCQSNGLFQIATGCPGSPH